MENLDKYKFEYYGEVTKQSYYNGFNIINNKFLSLKNTPKHFHSNNYLCYISSGEFIAVSENKSALGSTGDFIIQPAGMKHHNCFNSQNTNCINISFENEYLKLFNIKYLFNSFQKVQNIQMIGTIDKIIRESLVLDNFSNLIIQGLMLELLGKIGRLENIKEYDKPNWLKTVIEYLNEEYTKKYSLIDLANIANVHPSYLVNAFKKHTNQTVGEYIRNIRIKKACNNLRSDVSIVQIALDCGFADQSHLNRSFRKVTGMTPFEFRKRIYQN